jgi:adenosylcobinamide-phosphate synthase
MIPSLETVAWPEGVSAYTALLLLVVFIARLMPLPAGYHPLTLYRFFALQLGKKVNPDPNRPQQQLYISGSLALLLAWLMPMALLYSLYQFSDLPLVLDALLLYTSLDWRNQQLQAISIQHSLQQRQLSLARQQARTMLCRRTTMLSEMGLSKAMIESLTLRSAIQYLGVLCAFILAGGLAAIGYRLLLELHQQWNPKQQRFKHFGRPAAALQILFSAAPKLISSLLTALQAGVVRSYRQCRHRRLNMNLFSFLLFSCVSTALRRNLGGPLYYSDNKQQRSKMQQQHEPAPADISRALRLLQFNHGYFLLLLLAGSVLQLVWQLA